MNKVRTGNITTCIISGNQFLKVAEGLTTNGICNANRVRPFFVNAGLASELFLKSIQMREHGGTNFSSGHDLSDLYKDISQSAKDEIERSYNSMYEVELHKVELDSFLSNYSNPFIDFRYTFESGATAEGNSRALLYFAKSLKLYIDANIENGG